MSGEYVMFQPLVSVIMPAYNAEKYIGEAIQSIIAQTYENWELIIVEDCSNDNTLPVIKQFQDNRIHLYENDKNRGIAYSTNYAIEKSKGKYFALLDDDDYAMTDRLQLQVDYLEKHSDIDILGGMAVYMDENSEFISVACTPRTSPKYIKAFLLLNGIDFANSTAMIRREFIEKYNIRYRDNYYGMQDARFYVESSKKGNISSIPNYIVKHRLHKENTTKKMVGIYKEERKNKYAELQRYSLSASGFVLDEEELGLLNRVFGELEGGFETETDIREVYRVFQKLLRQAEDMDIDYYDELNFYLRMKFGDKIKTCKSFWKLEN